MDFEHRKQQDKQEDIQRISSDYTTRLQSTEKMATPKLRTHEHTKLMQTSQEKSRSQKESTPKYTITQPTPLYISQKYPNPKDVTSNIFPKSKEAFEFTSTNPNPRNYQKQNDFTLEYTQIERNLNNQPMSLAGTSDGQTHSYSTAHALQTYRSAEHKGTQVGSATVSPDVVRSLTAGHITVPCVTSSQTIIQQCVIAKLD